MKRLKTMALAAMRRRVLTLRLSGILHLMLLVTG